MGSSTRCIPLLALRGHARVFDVAVEDAQLVALADEHLGQLHQRAFAQIVGAGLERQAEQADLAGVVAGDEIERPAPGWSCCASTNRHRVLDVQLAGAIGEGAYILGQAGAAEGGSRDACSSATG